MADNTSIHRTSANKVHVIDLFCFKGAPTNQDEDRAVQVLVNNGYVSGFSPDRLQPLWVAYRVAGADQDVDYDRPHLYYDDQRLDAEHRISANTFGKHNGVSYHVGHMAPNEVINRQFGRLAQMETFFMSNMSPQQGTLNTGVWLDLENKIRAIEDTRSKDHVWVFTGPIFSDSPETIERPGGQKVPIPSSYYSIVIDPFRYPWDRKSNVDIACFIIPQDAERNTPLDDFLVNISDIENATNLAFFPQWPQPMAGLAPESQEPNFGRGENRHRLIRQLY